MSKKERRSKQRTGKPKAMTGEDKLKTAPKSELYIACEDLDLSFFHPEKDSIVDAWNMGMPLATIAERTNRDPDEIAILIIDLARKGKIKQRKGGVWGENNQQEEV